MRQPVPILGIPIDDLKHDELHVRMDGFLRGDGFHRIATVNPEFLVEADRNPTFRCALLSADLRIADGVGIVLAGWLRGRHIFRYPGADLLEAILAKAERERLPVFLATRKDGLSSLSEIKRALLATYPDLIVDGAEIADSGDVKYEPLDTKYKILLCNFGAPEQELFLASFHGRPAGVRLAIGIGGALDFLTGKQKRAPKWMRLVGLEWFWRLIVVFVPRENISPLYPISTRLVRVWNATAVFLWKVFLESVRKKTRS